MGCLFELKYHTWAFHGGSAVKNPPANAGDTGSIPDPGRSHMLWSSWVCGPQLLSLHRRAPGATTTEPTFHNCWNLNALGLNACALQEKPVLCNKRSPCSATREARALQQERPVLYKRSPCSATRKLSQWEASAPQPESSPHSLQTCAATKTQHSWKLINIYICIF